VAQPRAAAQTADLWRRRAERLAWPLILAESLGGLLILLGLHGRWVSLALLPILFGAIWVHAGNGWVFSNAGGGWEYPLFLAGASLAHVLLGDGRLALKR
jgi:putative oxidoreductase